ncbi:MAG TPA: HD domain-containing protein [Amycolatopsis sp.]|nr:HD domain-containing protein [Amycolatopsis sp.]
MTTATVETRQGAHLDDRIARLEARLVREQAHVAPEVVHEWVERARSRFDGARVQVFVPIFVERAVRSKLADPGGQTRSLRTWAWLTARNLLAARLPRRWAHTQGVSRRAAEIGGAFSPDDREVLVSAAWLHDIGYAEEVVDTGFHQLDGARYLRERGVSERVCALVAHHSGAAEVAELVGMSAELAVFDDEKSPVRDALWYCDSTRGPDGTPIAFEARLAEVRSRRGPADPVVRALAANGPERRAAVARTADLLDRAAVAR